LTGDEVGESVLEIPAQNLDRVFIGAEYAIVANLDEVTAKLDLMLAVRQ